MGLFRGGGLVVVGRGSGVDGRRHVDSGSFHGWHESRCREPDLSIVATVKRLKLHFQTVTPDHKRISHSVSVSIFSGYYS
jgi:hypothetical protein